MIDELKVIFIIVSPIVFSLLMLHWFKFGARKAAMMIPILIFSTICGYGLANWIIYCVDNFG